VLFAVGSGLLGLLWLIELTDDPTDGVAFYMLLFGAPLLIGVALVLVASQNAVATRSGLAGALLALVGALSPDILGLIAAPVGLLLLFVGVREHAHGLRLGLALLIAGLVGLAVRLDSGDGIVLFVPVLALGAAALAVGLRRIEV
jgi:sugar phosphate permease